MNELVSQSDQLNFDAQVLQSELPVLVDYWAEWCTPMQGHGAGAGRSGGRIPRPAAFLFIGLIGKRGWHGFRFRDELPLTWASG